MNNTIRKIAIVAFLTFGCFSASAAEAFTASTNIPLSLIHISEPTRP